jgi:CRP/FNR family transcriptional regulator, cyclic AMP receptor protein
MLRLVPSPWVGRRPKAACTTCSKETSPSSRAVSYSWMSGDRPASAEGPAVAAPSGCAEPGRPGGPGSTGGHSKVLLGTPARGAEHRPRFVAVGRPERICHAVASAWSWLGAPPVSQQRAGSPSPEAALAALPLFAGVPAPVRVAFANQGRLQRCRPGTVMFLQGDPPHAVYCILAGRVEITTTAADGRVRLIAILAAGDLLGELAVLGGMARSGSAICVADTTAWAIDGQRFRRFLTDHPPVALALLSSLSRLVTVQNGLVDDMLFLDLRGRVAKRLLGLAGKSPDAPPVNGAVVDWGLPQADLAYLCGGSRANVSRVLAEFGRRGLIERAGRRYVLRDVTNLRRLAGI